MEMEGRKQNDDIQDLDTIYKLSQSIKERLRSHGTQIPSPEESAELNRMIQRLIEIDTSSRGLLTDMIVVFPELETDEDEIEDKIKKKIQDPTSMSTVWELVYMVLAMQDELLNVELIPCSYKGNKGIKDRDDQEGEELILGRFKIRNLNTSGVKDRDDQEGEELILDRFKIRNLNTSGVKGLETKGIEQSKSNK